MRKKKCSAGFFAKASLEIMGLPFQQILCHYKSVLKYQRLFLRLHFLFGVTTWGQHHTRNGTCRLLCLEYCTWWNIWLVLRNPIYQKNYDKWETDQRTVTKMIRRLETLHRKRLQNQNLVCLSLVWLGAGSWPPSIWRVMRNYSA